MALVQTLKRAAAAFAKRRGALALAGAVVLLASLSSAVKPIDDGLYTARAALVTRAPTGSIVVVEIDTKSIRAAGAWPWPRNRYAIAIANLRNAGATLIGFDVDFSARSDAENDTALRSAVEHEPGSIVLPTFIQPGSKEANSPLASLSEDAVVGSVNVQLDADGKVRRYQRGYEDDGRYHASMAAILAGEPYGATRPFLIDYGVRLNEIDRLSFEDVYRGAFDPARVRGKTVLVGATALELGDEFATPVRPSMSGVYVHALAYESLTQKRAMVELNRFIVLGAALLVLLLAWPRPGALNLRRMFTAHAVLLTALLAAPVLIQALAPISVNLALVMLTQALCVIYGVHQEMSRREQEIAAQREAHLSYVALHDPETELPNRRAMLQDLARRLAAKDGVIAAVAIGVDRFAVLRGAIGYAQANEVVRRMSANVAAACGEDRVYHLSTSILGVVLSAADEDGAKARCDDLIAFLRADALPGEQDIETSARIGVAFGAANETAEKLLEHASLALDEARHHRRPQVEYDPQTEIETKLQLAMVADIRPGLERGEFTLAYQAKFSTQDRAVVGAEALIRWRHPRYGAISPDKFIGVAEETGAIDFLTRWTLKRAVADQAILRARGIYVEFSVNISARCLCDPGFCEFASNLIEQSGARLCFEITETAIIDDPLMAMASILAFRLAGVKISVDDFGSGLSSLAYLKQIAPDELKIDRSLICDLAQNPRDRVILESTIDLAHNLGMTVVTEGVEDEKTYALVAAMGGDCVQGFLLARPAPLSDLAALCVAERAALGAERAYAV